MQNKKIDTIIFDLGKVLINWDPRHLFSKIFDDSEKMEWFLEHVCNMDWNEEQDAGRTTLEATSVKIQEYPEYAEQIKAYYDRWTEMLDGPIDSSVEVLRKLKATKKYKILALTNWSAELFPHAIELFDFLNWFDGRVVSGEEKTRKPYPEIYHTLLSRYNVTAENSIFIDDNKKNIDTANKLNINGIWYQGYDGLIADLAKLGVEVE